MQKGSVNKVVLVGHLGGDPETRFAVSGSAVSTFNIATNESWKNSDGEFQDKTEWHRCVIFGKLAESASKVLKKGQLVYLEGKLQTRKWDDKEGMTRYTTEVVCDMFTMLGRKVGTDDLDEMPWDDNKDDSSVNKKDDDEKIGDSQEAPASSGEEEDDLPF